VYLKNPALGVHS